MSFKGLGNVLSGDIYYFPIVSFFARFYTCSGIAIMQGKFGATHFLRPCASLPDALYRAFNQTPSKPDRLARQNIKVHRHKMTGATEQDKHMEYGMVEFYFFDAVYARAYGIGNAASKEPEQAL